MKDSCQRIGRFLGGFDAEHAWASKQCIVCAAGLSAPPSSGNGGRARTWTARDLFRVGIRAELARLATPRAPVARHQRADIAAASLPRSDRPDRCSLRGHLALRGSRWTSISAGRVLPLARGMEMARTFTTWSGCSLLRSLGCGRPVDRDLVQPSRFWQLDRAILVRAPWDMVVPDAHVRSG